MKDYNKAIDCYEKVFTKYKDEIRADNSIYELAQLYDYTLNDKEKAKALYERLFNEYTGSVFAFDARQRFRVLRGDVDQ
jgi:TolA-binding protein